jgi:hypothetical protein
MPATEGKAWQTCTDRLQPEFECWKQSSASVPAFSPFVAIWFSKKAPPTESHACQIGCLFVEQDQISDLRVIPMEKPQNMTFPQAADLGYPSGRELGGRFAKVPV